MGKNHNIKVVKDSLEIIIDYMDKNKEIFVKNPETDFVRNRKVEFKDMLKIILAMKGDSLDKEIYDYFRGDDERIFKGNNFVQQREKIKDNTFEFLFDMFNIATVGKKTYKNYRLFAVDGSEIDFSSDNKETENLEENESDLFNLNVTYDLLNKTYTKAILQAKGEINERRALIDMLKSEEHTEKTLYICDRGYPSWNVFTHFKYTENADFLIRYPNERSRLTADLPETTFDIMQNIIISPNIKNCSVKRYFRNDYYAYISPNTVWDFGNYEKLKVRIIRFELNPGEYETLITSLPKKEFSLEEVLKLYKMRWGVEVSFKDLKSQMGLTQLASKRKDFVKQDVFARLVMYNFSRKIINEVEEKLGARKNLIYRTNFNMGFHICREYFLDRVVDDKIYNLLAKYSNTTKGK